MSVLKDAENLAVVQAEIARSGVKPVVKIILAEDSFHVLVLFRLRQFARKWRIPLVNRFLRLWQLSVYGIDLGADVELGSGVYFVHTAGTVVGGNAKPGARVRLMGNNTVGNASEDGYPVIGEDVTIGCGARILGPVHVGKRAVIGANAVVVKDVEPGSTVVGIPAKPIVKKESGKQRDV